MSGKVPVWSALGQNSSLGGTGARLAGSKASGRTPSQPECGDPHTPCLPRRPPHGPDRSPETGPHQQAHGSPDPAQVFLERARFQPYGFEVRLAAFLGELGQDPVEGAQDGVEVVELPQTGDQARDEING